MVLERQGRAVREGAEPGAVVGQRFCRFREWAEGFGRRQKPGLRAVHAKSSRADGAARSNACEDGAARRPADEVQHFFKCFAARRLACCGVVLCTTY